MSQEPIYVTQPVLPELAEFIPYLEQIWKNKILTNCGPLHQQLEKELCEYLGVDYISLFNNGTIALVTALQALGLEQGEVITTPYTFVATAHSIVWNKLTPVFVDIDPQTSNIDPIKVEMAITDKTVAILPVHCYGIPCDVEALQNIATTHNLKLVYDAAHAFGVKHHGKSLLNYGDLSVMSFHATKVFNTFEGGAIVCHSAEMKQRIDRLKNFGIVNESTIDDISLNGKLSEVHAALGLLQLKSIDSTLLARQKLDEMYRKGLAA
jgi:dTDP-4-amino-4,6-dideoxy-D-glucose transaminase